MSTQSNVSHGANIQAKGTVGETTSVEIEPVPIASSGEHHKRGRKASVSMDLSSGSQGSTSTSPAGSRVKPLRATYGSADRPLRIGDIEMPCYVLENGMRVLSGRGMQEALGLGQRSGTLLRSFFNSYLSRPDIKPLVGEKLAHALQNPIRFWRPGRGGKLAVGYEATILADICEVILEARSAGVLVAEKDSVLAKQCEMLIRAFGKVGIIALVDEATGFQQDRARDALEEILKKFISEELLKWAKTFPDEFYRELFRLRGIRYLEVSTRRPAYIGSLTNDIVYERLAPGVLDELKRVTPKDDKGRRKHKYFMRLTEDVGNPKLREHLSNVITLMRAAPNWLVFHRLLERSLPKYPKVGDQLRLDFGVSHDSGGDELGLS